MIQTSIQFVGSPNDDTNAYIVNFLEICDTFKHNGIDVFRLRLFPISPWDKAKSWLSWLAQKFLYKYFLLAKIEKMNDITSFVQFDFESLYEAWKRYKNSL